MGVAQHVEKFGAERVVRTGVIRITRPMRLLGSRFTLQEVKFFKLLHTETM